MSETSTILFDTRCADQRRPLLAYLYALSGDYHVAEDLVQETLLVASAKREHYFPEADFGAWLRAIARNVWMRERRASGRRPTPSPEAVEILADRICDPAQYAEPRWQAEKAALAECLDRLEAGDREMIRSHFWSGRRYEELAQAAGRTLAWVKVRMFRARRLLAECVRRRVEHAGEVGR
jgi:RNA polymerase sigma-70 factor (ECF subfamily)